MTRYIPESEATKLSEDHVAKRGWSSHGLQVVDAEEARYWSTDDAARFLGPPALDQAQVRQLIKLTGIEPVGKRRVTLPGQRGGRHVRVYDSVELIKAYDAISSVLR